MERDIDRIIVVDLRGAMAHFRAFYTNSSSLTYSFPPRTVITGLLAGIMGRPRDSYYEEFSREKCRIGLAIRSPFRKIMNTLNYLWAKSPSDFVRRSGNPLQVQFEALVPCAQSAGWGELVYRMFIWHSNLDILNEIRKRVEMKQFVYPPYMGISEFTAELEFIQEITGHNIQVVDSENCENFSTILNAAHIADRGLEFQSGELQYMKEVMPLEFKSDRSSRATGKFIFERNLNHIRARLTTPFIRAGGENIAFMEDDYA